LGVELTTNGFRCETAEVEWESVEAIRAFKLDLATFDEIRFSLQIPGGVVEVSEEQPGFAAFAHALERQFPSVVGWYARVAQPAFARNETVLWVRS